MSKELKKESFFKATNTEVTYYLWDEKDQRHYEGVYKFDKNETFDEAKHVELAQKDAATQQMNARIKQFSQSVQNTPEYKKLVEMREQGKFDYFKHLSDKLKTDKHEQK